MSGLAEASNLPVSQGFAGSFYLEPEGWVAYRNDHVLKAYGSKFPGSVYRHDVHKGLDAYGEVGTPLGAPEAGKIIERFTDGTGAKVIGMTIRGHANSRIRLIHCDSFIAPLGAIVARGEYIARLGKTGYLLTGAHVHKELAFHEKGSDGVWRWITYDIARFTQAGTYRLGAGYGGAVLFGGDMVYDERIYPIRKVTINAETRIRAGRDVESPVLVTTANAISATQINELPGGTYEVNGAKGVLWAKVKVTIGSKLVAAYVAKPLIKAA